MRKFNFGSEINIGFNPAWYFFVFFLSNVLLSYFELSLNAKLQVGLFGLAVPLIIALTNKASFSREEKSSGPANDLPDVPGWFWGLVFIFGCFLRFYHLTALSTWPFSDEAVYAFGAFEISQNNAWHFLYSPVGQHPPLSVWVQGLFFKIMQPSIFSLWLFTALLSVLALLFAYWACRKYFSKPFAFTCLAIAATSFWPLYIGRFCNNETFSSFWEFLVLLLLVLFLKSASKSAAWKYALALGFCTGAGFFTFVVWAVVAFLVTLAVVYAAKVKTREVYIGFFLPLIALTLIFCFFYIRESHLDAIRIRLAFLPGDDWKQQWMTIIDNFSTILWGCPEYRYIDYGPVWGGLLNPVLGSFFFLGVIQCCVKRHLPFIRWLALGLFIFILPGFISKGLDNFRIIYILPLLIIVSALGISSFNSALKRFRAVTLSILLIFGFSLDFYHFYGVYHSIWGEPGPQWSYLKSVPLHAAYQVLERKARRTGPGMILSDLRPITYDQTLTIAAFPFDAAHNKKIPFQKAKWVALIVSGDYKPFLSTRFPGVSWFDLGKEQSWDKIVWRLGVIPITANNQGTMKHWLEANDAFREVTARTMNNIYGKSLQPIYEHFLLARDLMAGDPFLESCFWEKIIYFYWAVEGNARKSLEAADQYLKYGYPSPRIQKLRRFLMGISHNSRGT